MNDELRVAHEIQQFGMYLGERRLLRQLLAGQAVHRECALLDVAFGIHIAMERSAGEAPVVKLQTADFDDAMLTIDFEAGGLRIEDDLTHANLTARQQPVYGAIGQLIHVLVAVVAGMPADPMPFDILRRRGRIELLP